MKPRLHVIDGLEKKAFLANPRNVAAERDFNRVDVEGVAPDKFEVGLNAFESEVSAAIKKGCVKTRTSAIPMTGNRS